MWLRYQDDTFVIQKEDRKQNILENINSVDPAIKFTVEDNKEDGAIPFSDTIVKPEADGRLSITVYRKPNHTYQYLQWDTITYQPSIVSYTLNHRDKTVCNKSELLQKEMDHLRKALTHCKYPKWALDKAERMLFKPISEHNNDANNQGSTGAKPTTSEVNKRVI